jgi:hypothetical protein
MLYTVDSVLQWISWQVDMLEKLQQLRGILLPGILYWRTLTGLSQRALNKRVYLSYRTTCAASWTFIMALGAI